MTRVEVFERTDSKWDWRLIAPNGEEVCGSLQGYEDRGKAHEGFLRCAAAILKGGWEFHEVPRDL